MVHKGIKISTQKHDRGYRIIMNGAPTVLLIVPGVDPKFGMTRRWYLVHEGAPLALICNCASKADVIYTARVIVEAAEGIPND